MSSEETEYVNGRSKHASRSLRDFVESAHLGSDFDASLFFADISKNITIAIAISGGGYRSMLNGAGALMAFDQRTPNSTILAGILQSTTYISGVSGGAWLVSSLISHNFRSVHDLKSDENAWKFDESLLEGIPSIDFEAQKDSFDSRKYKRDIGAGIINLEDVPDELFQEYTKELLRASIKGVAKKPKNSVPADILAEPVSPPAVPFKRELQSSIRKSVKKFLEELNMLNGDFSTFSSNKIQELIENHGSSLGTNHIFSKTTHETSVISLTSLQPTTAPRIGLDDYSSFDVTVLESTHINTYHTEAECDHEGIAIIEKSRIEAPASKSPANDNLLSPTTDFVQKGSQTMKFHSKQTDSSKDILVGEISKVENVSTFKIHDSLKPDGQNWKKVSDFYQELHTEVREKRLAGFKTTFTDYWARALARLLYLNNETGNYITLSSIRESESFKEHNMPFPIILSDSCWPGMETNSETSHIFEFNPYEFGSWDQYLNAFIDMRFLGSPLLDGEPVFKDFQNRSLCVSGYDDLFFITGISSSLFNNVLIYIWQAVSSAKKKTSAVMQILLYAFGLGMSSERVSKNHPDYAILAPNPFFGLSTSNASLDFVQAPHLFMVDGGEDKQNIPFHPFLQKSRMVDVVIAVDSTADKEGFPNGTSLRATFARYAGDSVTFTAFGERSVFPKVPKNNILSPMFLGCNIDDYPFRGNALTRESDGFIPPIIIYFPNRDISFRSNMSTFKLSYSELEVSLMLTNGAALVTLETYSPEFKQCIACAFIKREFDRMSLAATRRKESLNVPRICAKCFSKYCFS